MASHLVEELGLPVPGEGRGEEEEEERLIKATKADHEIKFEWEERWIKTLNTAL